MFTFRKITSLKSFACFLGFTAAAGIGKLKHDNLKKKNEIKNSLHYKTVQNIITLDPKFYNLVGQNHTIKDIIPVEEDSKYLSYRIVFNGFKGDSKVLVKLTKESYEQIREINEKNAKYSLLEGKEKIKFMYLALNMNDVLIPTEDTLNRIANETQNNKSLNESFKNYLNYLNDNLLSYSDKSSNKNKLSQIKNTKNYLYDYPSNLIPLNKKSNKSFNYEDIDKNSLNYNENDTFWRINSILMTTNGSFVNSIRPKTGLSRVYDNEDTYSSTSNVIDTFKQIELMRIDNIAKISEVELLSSIKSELITRKSIVLNDQRERRKKILIMNLVIYMVLFSSYAFFNSKRLYIRKFDKIKEILNSNPKLSNQLGRDYNFSHYNYNYNVINNNYNIQLNLNNTNYTECRIDSTVEFNSISSAYILSDTKVTVKDKSLSDENNLSMYYFKQAYLIDNFEKPEKDFETKPNIFKQNYIYTFDSKNQVFKSLTN
jgi:hypothetical protein